MEEEESDKRDILLSMNFELHTDTVKHDNTKDGVEWQVWYTSGDHHSIRFLKKMKHYTKDIDYVVKF